MKIYQVLITIVFISLNVFSFSLKDYIPIIKPNIHDSTSKTLIDIAEYLENRGYENAGSVFRSYAEGGHGSGFIVQDETGSCYIITNKHVVKHGVNTTVTFKNQDNVNTTYENAEILYVDDVLDLAVIDVKLTKTNSLKFLTLSNRNLNDGENVWSVGYPGLLGQPGWQFASGIITNSRAYVDDILDTSVSHLIQHSASIDPGNSGGPLLIKDKSDNKTGYKVVGVNTWLIRGRQNTFFAIPSARIKEVLKKANDVKRMRLNYGMKIKQLEESCKIMAAELNSKESKYSKTKNYISYQFVGTAGWESYLYVYNRLTSDEQISWNTLFFNVSPIETMRMALFLRLKKMFESETNTVEFVDINLADRGGDNDTVRTNFNMGEKKYEISWVYEFGHWRISNVNFEKYKKASYKVIKAASASSDESKTLDLDVDSTTEYREGPPAIVNFLLPGYSQYRYKNKFLAAFLTTAFVSGAVLTTTNEISFQRNWRKYETETDPSIITGLYDDCERNRNLSITGISIIGGAALISFIIEAID